jgi:hypothetical protein
MTTGGNSGFKHSSTDTDLGHDHGAFFKKKMYLEVSKVPQGI